MKNTPYTVKNGCLDCELQTSPQPPSISTVYIFYCFLSHERNHLEVGSRKEVHRCTVEIQIREASRWKRFKTIPGKNALPPPLNPDSTHTSESGQGGWKTRGGRGTYRKPLPEERLWTPPPAIRSPPPFLATLCHFS